MLVEIRVPVLAESVPDATLLAWRKQVGEHVERGENLIDLETDKVTLEIAAPDAGVLVEIRMQAGETALSDDILAVIDTAATAAMGAATSATAAAAAVTATPSKLGPAARKLLDEHGVDAAAIPSARKDGRVTKGDVLDYVERSSPAAKPAPLTSAPRPGGARPLERVAMTRLRKRTAERLLQAQHQAAILTTFNEVNMQALLDLRTRYKDDFKNGTASNWGLCLFS